VQFLREPDHFSASLEPIAGSADESIATKPSNKRFSRRKIGRGLEQNGVVAAPSQLRTVGARALPRSNQIEATLFD
jgi:hypothetical protein